MDASRGCGFRRISKQYSSGHIVSLSARRPPNIPVSMHGSAGDGATTHTALLPERNSSHARLCRQLHRPHTHVLSYYCCCLRAQLVYMTHGQSKRARLLSFPARKPALTHDSCWYAAVGCMATPLPVEAHAREQARVKRFPVRRGEGLQEGAVCHRSGVPDLAPVVLHANRARLRESAGQLLALLRRSWPA